MGTAWLRVLLFVGGWALLSEDYVLGGMTAIAVGALLMLLTLSRPNR